MSQTRILSIIPESLHEELFQEVQAVIDARSKANDNIISPDVKSFVDKQKAFEKQAGKIGNKTK